MWLIETTAGSFTTAAPPEIIALIELMPDFVSACKISLTYPPSKADLKAYISARWTSRELSEILYIPSSEIRHWMNEKSTPVIDRQTFEEIMFMDVEPKP